MNYTDKHLKAALAKMLPDDLYITLDGIELHWSNSSEKCLRECRGWEVRDTELLHLCWLVAKTFNTEQCTEYAEILGRDEEYANIYYDDFLIMAAWQKRVSALAKIKGIEI